MAEPWLSGGNVAAHLRVTKDTVYTSIVEKAMAAHTIGRLWRCQASEIGGAAADSEPSPPG